MKNKILIFIIGVLVGAIIATIGFYIYKINTDSKLETNRPEMMNFQNRGNRPDMNQNGMQTPPDMSDGNMSEPPAMPDGENVENSGSQSDNATNEQNNNDVSKNTKSSKKKSDASNSSL